MINDEPSSGPIENINPSDFDIGSLEDEIRVDALCVELLQATLGALSARPDCDPAAAGAICHGADHFLREFIIADRKENLFAIDPERVRQFAGHWYIIRNMEPNLPELQIILNGTAAFYLFLAERGLYDPDCAAAIAFHAADTAWQQQRIDDFWALEAGGYNAWRAACPLEPVPDWP